MALPAPASVRRAFREGLALHAAGRGGAGLRPETVAWARRLADGQPLTLAKARKARAWFARHGAAVAESARRQGDPQSPAAVAWLLWGGDPSIAYRRGSWRDPVAPWLDRALAGLERRDNPSEPARALSVSRASHRTVTAADAHALFERQREAFAALFPAVSRARLHIVRRACPHALAPCAGRDLAWMVDGDVHLLARALQRGPNVVGALLAHELGHAADASRYLPGSEQRADDLAAVVLGKPIRYTAADSLQTFGPGAWPRPLHLHR